MDSEPAPLAARGESGEGCAGLPAAPLLTCRAVSAVNLRLPVFKMRTFW